MVALSQRDGPILIPRPGPLRWVPVSYSAAWSGPGLTLFTSSNSGAACSTATVSTAGVTGCLLRRAAFFTGARLNLALATVVAFPRAAFDGLRALRRAVAPVLFCTFDAFLRLAVMDTPGLVCAPQRTQVGHPHPVKHRQVHGQATWTWLRRKVRQVWDGARTSRPWIWLAKDAPTQRTVQRSGSIVTMPILSGLHHRYARI